MRGVFIACFHRQIHGRFPAIQPRACQRTAIKEYSDNFQMSIFCGGVECRVAMLALKIDIVSILNCLTDFGYVPQRRPVSDFGCRDHAVDTPMVFGKGSVR